MYMYGAVYSGRECTGWGVDTEGAKFPEASFPTANLFTTNFPRTGFINLEKSIARHIATETHQANLVHIIL